MPKDTDHLAQQIEATFRDFSIALREPGNYPADQFEKFAELAERYIAATKFDPMLHRGVIVSLNDLALTVQRTTKTVPYEIIVRAESIEANFFHIHMTDEEVESLSHESPSDT